MHFVLLARPLQVSLNHRSLRLTIWALKHEKIWHELWAQSQRRDGEEEKKPKRPSNNKQTKCFNFAWMGCSLNGPGMRSKPAICHRCAPSQQQQQQITPLQMLLLLFCELHRLIQNQLKLPGYGYARARSLARSTLCVCVVSKVAKQLLLIQFPIGKQ